MFHLFDSSDECIRGEEGGGGGQALYKKKEKKGSFIAANSQAACTFK
jgi:hypothetical protein